MASTSVSSVWFSSDSLEQTSVDGSDLTGSIRYQDEDLSTTDEFGVKLSADTYYYLNHHTTTPHESERKEVLELKLQILRQQEKIDALSSNLSECQDVIEVHEKEKAVLIDELALETPEEKQPTQRGWFPKGSNVGGSMQLLIDELGKSMADNARLQTVIDVMRKSYQSHVKESRQRTDEDAQTIKALQHEVNVLKQQSSAPKAFKMSLGEHTTKTSLDSSYTDTDVSDLLQSSLHSIPEQEFGVSGDDWTVEGENDEESIYKLLQDRRASCRGGIPQEIGLARSKSEDLLVDFGDNPEQPRRKSVTAARMADTRLTQSLTEAPLRKTEDPLLVEFDERRRSKAKAQRWGSWKW